MFAKAKGRNVRIPRLIFFVLCLAVMLTVGLDGNHYIQVIKKNVLYKFVPFDKTTDLWVRNVFPHWETETFDVFDAVKDSGGIAIDIGAWIGATTIWLSKNFSYVVAVEADKVSLQCLKKNLEASGCTNVIVCESPIAAKIANLVFGPAGGQKLNDSMSHIKDKVTSADDYIVKSITFKRLISDYVYSHFGLLKKISFIKCDIEGGEENIISDMLFFALYANVKVHLSFHVTWWKTKKIEDFEGLFKLFKTNCPQVNICNYLKQNPFAALLFEPL